MSAELDAVLRGLEKLQAALEHQARLEFVNSLLSIADADEVLPVPSVSLMAVDTERSVAFAPSLVFRSVDALGLDGEQYLTPVQPDATQIHPWKVESVASVSSDGLPAPTAMLGLDVILRREPLGTSGAGWLNLSVEAPDAAVVAASRSAFASVGEQRMDWRPVEWQREGAPSSRRVAVRVAGMLQGLMQLRISSELARSDRILVALRYRDHRLLGLGTSLPVVRANVIPVWNSLPAKYPSAYRIGAVMSDLYNRNVHPLTTEGLGPHWFAWRVDRVGAAVDARTTFSPEGECSSTQHSDGGFRLAFVNLSSENRTVVAGPGPPRPILTVVTDDLARRTLERRSQRLQIDFQATTGAACNGIQKGTEFQLVDLSGFLEPRVRGTLLHRTLGGSSGIVSSTDGADAVRPFVPSRRRRSVREVLAYVRGAFGEELEVVDPSRLLRYARGNTVAPLSVPVRFHRPTSSHEARVLLTACQELINDYLVADDIGPVALVPEEDEHNRS